MQEEVKLCKDCKHFLQRYQNDPDCTRAAITTDLVYGNKTFNPCTNERSYPSKCGPEGKYFEIKNAKPVGPSNQVIVSLWSNIKQSLKGEVNDIL